MLDVTIRHLTIGFLIARVLNHAFVFKEGPAMRNCRPAPANDSRSVLRLATYE